MSRNKFPPPRKTHASRVLLGYTCHRNLGFRAQASGSRAGKEYADVADPAVRLFIWRAGDTVFLPLLSCRWRTVSSAPVIWLFAERAVIAPQSRPPGPRQGPKWGYAFRGVRHSRGKSVPRGRVNLISTPSVVGVSESWKLDAASWAFSS